MLVSTIQMNKFPNQTQSISFLSLAAGHFLNLLFDHGNQRLVIHDLLAPNTLVNMLPDRDEASKMGDLDADLLLIVRRLKVVNEPFYQLIFHHGGLYFFSVLIRTMRLRATYHMDVGPVKLLGKI